MRKCLDWYILPLSGGPPGGNKIKVGNNSSSQQQNMGGAWSRTLLVSDLLFLGLLLMKFDGWLVWLRPHAICLCHIQYASHQTCCPLKLIKQPPFTTPMGAVLCLHKSLWCIRSVCICKWYHLKWKCCHFECWCLMIDLNDWQPDYTNAVYWSPLFSVVLSPVTC